LLVACTASAHTCHLHGISSLLPPARQHLTLVTCTASARTCHLHGISSHLPPARHQLTLVIYTASAHCRLTLTTWTTSAHLPCTLTASSHHHTSCLLHDHCVVGGEARSSCHNSATVDIQPVHQASATHQQQLQPHQFTYTYVSPMTTVPWGEKLVPIGTTYHSVINQTP